MNKTSNLNSFLNHEIIWKGEIIIWNISDFDHLHDVSNYDGVYVLWDKENNSIYVGHARKMSFKKRFLNHYEYIKQAQVHSITIYPTNEHSLLEFTLIKRLKPIYNGDLDWNRIVHGRHSSKPYLLSEDSYWGHKFFKKRHLPFEMNSPEDHEYLQGIKGLIVELERLRSLRGRI